MVYCGKPSKGCSSCRERKIRCDQKEPGCGQCEKRQQQCPGYRNLVDLMFRDESSHVIKKAARTKARGRLKNAQASSTTHAAESFENAPASISTDPESSDPSPRPAVKPGARRQYPSRPLAVITQNIAIRHRPHQARWASSSESDEDDDSLLPSPEKESWPATQQATPLYSLSPSYQERGTAFFFSRYVSVDENACHQNYDFIFDIWRPASMFPERQVDGVMASMTAVGLAGLSHLTMCPEMMDWSRRSYGTALQMTNDALRNPAEAVKDTTMLSILILGTYEMLSGRSNQTVRAWQNHINGASALAKMRGLKQFMTRAGVRMFVMLTQIVLINCMQKDMPMPQPLIELRNQLGMLSGGADPNWRISGPIYKVMQLRYDINSGKLSHTADIIDQLSKVDQEFADVITELPEFWKYRPVKLSTPHPAVFDGHHCDVYPTLGLAATWNGVRSIRMMVHETIIGELFKCFPDHHIIAWPYEAKLQLAKSVELLEKLRDRVIASVPQHFGIVSFKDAMSEGGGSATAVITAKKSPVHIVPSPTTSASSSPPSSVDDPMRRPAVFNGPTLHDPAHMKGRSDNAERFMTLASASNTVVWPLYLVGVSSCGTEEVKKYVVERLQAILEESGLLQARGVALMVRNKEVCIPWSDVSWDRMPQTQIPLDLYV
ncbi:C6 finger domain-containing protein [Colletotrichum incanum]|nr:C6 finger domain-containing protein [Colletotrichum incanum]